MQMKQKGSRKAGRVLWEEVGTERQADGWEDQTREDGRTRPGTCCRLESRSLGNGGELRVEVCGCSQCGDGGELGWRPKFF